MKQRAFTLIEMLVAVAIVLVLFGAMITVTKHLKAESQRRLTASAIAVLSTALDQYYENTSPKAYPPQIDTQTALEAALSKTITVSAGHPVPDAFPLTEDVGTVFWRSEAAYYFLTRIPQSKAILESLSNQMISNRYDGSPLRIEIPTGAAATDWVHFVDAWGTSLNYRYQSGDTSPVLTSAGPDKVFGTGDDVVF